MDGGHGPEVASIEHAMVAIRRAQTRRALGRLSARRGDRAGPVASLPDAVFELLDVIEAAGTPPTVSEAAVGLGVDQPRASRLAAAAAAAGLLRRGVDQADGRRSPLSLTTAGRQALTRIHAFRQQVIAESLADWSAADRVVLARLLSRFVTDMAAVTDSG
jgi:DNA-binding MarR family transcriptional regulator